MSEDQAYIESVLCPQCQKRVHPTNWKKHWGDNHAAVTFLPLHALGKELPITAIRRDGGTQSRAGLNEDTIGEYVQAMQDGAEFPAIHAFYDGSTYWLADGFHRVEAAQRAGWTDIPAIIEDGGQREAILYSVGANAAHGLRRTNEDKRRAVTRLLEDGEWVQWSDRQIAKACHVHHELVGRVRRDLFPHTGGNASVKRVYTNGAGNQKVMDTGKIGKSRPVPTITRTPTPDDYTPDVPSVSIEPPGVPPVPPPLQRPRPDPNVENPFGVKDQIMAGAQPTQTGEAPRIGGGGYIAQRVNGDMEIQATNGRVLATFHDETLFKKVWASLTQPPAPAPEATKPQAPSREPLLVVLGGQVGIKVDSIYGLLENHKEPIVRPVLMLCAALKVKPADPAALMTAVQNVVKESKHTRAGGVKVGKSNPGESKANRDDMRLNAYYEKNATDLDALRTAWGDAIELYHWKDLTTMERQERTGLHVQLVKSGLSASDYCALITYARQDWGKIPLRQVASKVTAFKQSRQAQPSVPNIDPRWGEDLSVIRPNHDMMKLVEAEMERLKEVI